ncbi:MAG: hypothetical protein GF416_03030 [Candidatus Altiarchaeales archaeon]|nr:hypothetical protein [Candidatus Altiarchaeales archaeon]MBD3416094.1 hypothetical protein [Candidatus Altiarchaeales archaeon]
MVSSMNRNNILAFIAVVVVMVYLASAAMSGGGLKVLGKTIGSAYAGRPEVRPPFPRESYSIEAVDGGVRVSLSEGIGSEYEGQYLSVYAYDDVGGHVVRFKRVVSGEMFISDGEDASFIVLFNGDKVSEIVKPDVGYRFNPVLLEAMDASRNFGLERCLLGKQGETICPVFALELVKDEGEYGRVKPVIDRNKCIEDGVCTVVCPTRLLYRED